MGNRLSRWTVSAVALAVVAIAAHATAAEDDAAKLGMQIRNAVEHGKGLPALIFTPTKAVETLTIELTRDGARTNKIHVGALKRGESHEATFEQPEGSWEYQATVKGKWKSGAPIAFAFAFTAKSLPPLEVFLDKKDVDLARQKLHMRLSRPPARVQLLVIGDGGQELDRVDKEVRSLGRTLDLSWSSGTATVERLSLRVHDENGFWVGIEVIPFTVFIPHDEVEFEFGKAGIRPSEEPKLLATLELLEDALRKHGGEIEVHLFIAGYTDTVGSRAANQELSDRRARSIAAWFRAHGVKVPIFYQGFGEDVLKVPTADDTPEAHNRRAIYVLSAGPPTPNETIPRTNWKPL